MTRDETIALWQECEDARAAALAEGRSDDEAHEEAKAIWNEWADNMCAIRHQLECAGSFKTKLVKRNRWHELLPAGGVEAIFPANEETGDWHKKAQADFSSFVFGCANFCDFRFPGETIFLHANFSEDCLFQNAIFFHTANFMHSHFHKSSQFQEVKFHSLTLFELANFNGPAKFSGAVFESEARFSRAKFLGASVTFETCSFKGPIHFFLCKFKGAAWFEATTFNDHAEWGRAEFDFTANFQNCLFRGSSDVAFVQTWFKEFTRFNSCCFNAGANFHSAKTERYFSLEKAKFKGLPRFNQADFQQAPDLDNVLYPLPLFWKNHDKSLISSYRALRRIAIQGHDHENEAKAFKGEIRSKRGTEHKPWHAAFWFGIFYDVLSDFGRSMMRPFGIWLLSVPAFATAYLLHAGKLSAFSATCADGTAHWLKSLIFALKNPVLFVNWDREQIRSAYACLYDLQPGNLELTVPTTNAIIQVGQSIWSAILIFLFLLAVRNQFKIK